MEELSIQGRRDFPTARPSSPVKTEKPADVLPEPDAGQDHPTAKTALLNRIAGSSEEECEGYLEIFKAIRGVMRKK